MAEPSAPRVLDETGPAAPPRRNGELVFEEVWHARIFGLTMALHEAGLFAWDEFRQRLIAEIRDWETAHPSLQGYRYYDRWLAAFERLVADKDLCPPGELAKRVHELGSRPAGHDH